MSSLVGEEAKSSNKKYDEQIVPHKNSGKSD